MKKLFIAMLFCALFSPLPLSADDDADYSQMEKDLSKDIDEMRAKAQGNAGGNQQEKTEEKTRSETLLVKNRTIEIGIANFSIGFPSNIFNEVVIIDIEDLGKGYPINLSVAPLYFKLNINDDWGFGVFTGVDAAGDITLPKKLVSFSPADKEKSSLAAAAFAEAGVDGFFHIKKVPVLEKIKLKAGFSSFMPLMYVNPGDITYTFKDNLLNLDFDLWLYSAITDKGFSLDKKLGFDMRLGAEYPLASFIDIGLDVTNIPLAAATLTDVQNIKGYVNLDGGKLLNNDADTDNLFHFEDMEWALGKREIRRPFKTLVWADWRPFDIKLFSVIGSVGFQINPLYAEPFSMEGGLKARYNLGNLFIATAGVRHENRLWINGIDLVLNLRAFELDLGIDMRSPDFVESWKGGFMGLSFGIKTGW